MRINVMNDVVPPVVVAGAEILTAKSTQLVMGQPVQRVVNFAMTGLGYLAYAMGWGGNYSELIKNIGIASAPATLIGLYNAIGKPVPPYSVSRGAVSRPVMRNVSRSVSRYPGPAQESPFQGVRLV